MNEFDDEKWKGTEWVPVDVSGDTDEYKQYVNRHYSKQDPKWRKMRENSYHTLD